MFSKFFIQRPIFAIVIAIIMVMGGVLCFRLLPIAQYPNISPPTVMVSAQYPGADATTVANTVGAPLEQQINGVDNMMYMSSQSSDGQYMLTITFEVGTDVDQAAIKVQNRVSQVQSTLPSPVIENGVTVQKRSSNMLLFLALEADTAMHYDALYLTNYAQLHINEALSRVEGVGEVQAFGGGDYSMRVWLDPQKMYARGLTPADIREAIESQNIDVSAGDVGADPGSDSEFQYTLTSKGMLQSAKEFGDIIIKTDADGGILHLRDIARVELGSDSYSNIARVNGVQTALIAVSQNSDANAVSTANGVIAELERLKPYFPAGVDYRIIQNTTDFINASIDDLAQTFVETTLIVMIVILLFLQSWRATIIPMLTIPVSLIATFAVMYIMGFSLNTLTLFGLVLAIAIVVDDAIVVVEDVSRLLATGKYTSREAAIQAMKELTGPIVGEVLVLLSVFIPTAFISGMTGELYKQFALTIAVSTAFSGFNALTFTPAMCALFMRPPKPSKFVVYKAFNKGFGATLALYMRIVGTFLRKPRVAIAAYLVIVALAFWAFIKTPTTYIPEEDMGYFMTNIQLPVDASLERTDAISAEVARAIGKVDGVRDVMTVAGYSFMGGSGSNMGGCFVILEPWAKRKAKSLQINEIIGKVNEITARYQEPVIFSLNPPAIPGLGMTSGLQMQILDINALGPQGLMEAIDDIRAGAAKDPNIKEVTSLYEGLVPQYLLKVDRDRAKLMGIPIENIYNAISSYVGGSFVNEFEDFNRMYQVTLGGMAKGRNHPEDVLQLAVANSKGEMVPFSSFASIQEIEGAPQVDRYNMYTTAQITATPADGVSTSEAIASMEKILGEQLGNNYSYAWTGEAMQETQSGATITTVLLFAVIMTLLVLAAQYGSLTDPVAVVIAMPTAILGAVIGCFFMGEAVSIYTQIGIILLLGLSAKNAILIVEYAMDYRRGGMPIRQAAADAGRVRFRPIMMTALAFVFGVMPMLFASGAGAASQKALGAAVVFGMLINAVVGTLFVPNFWELLQRFGEKHLAGFFNASSGQTAQSTQTQAPSAEQPSQSGHPSQAETTPTSEQTPKSE